MEKSLMWMSADDAHANCPTLLGKMTPKQESSRRIFPPDVMLDEASLLEMKADVRNLVQRAAWQLASTTVPQSSILNTIQVLGAYASIGSLMGVFKETGALSLLMKMLCNEEEQVCRSAGKILRALASHDAGSRAYVLLSLSQQDGIEEHMDFDSRYTLLELFAETTSSEEHCMSFEGIPLPQIPGKLLFSLVKRYLCAISLVDKRHSGTDLGGESTTSDFGACSRDSKRLQREFDFSMALASLISELVQAMGWDRGWQLRSRNRKPPWAIQSIFQAQAPSGTTVLPATGLPRKETSTFKLRSAFPSRNSYVEYVQEKLVRGMRVRMLEDYEKVCAGDEGEFLQSNDGTPPIQVYWESLGRTYWVHWHMVEIIGSSGHADEKAREKLTSLTDSLRQDPANQAMYHKAFRGLYLAPYLTDHMKEQPETLSRAEWWELLFFVKKLEQQEQQKVVELIQQNEKLLELDEESLILLPVSIELAQKVLQFLSRCCQGNAQSDLRRSHVYVNYFSREGEAEQEGQKVGLAPAKHSGLSKATASRKTEEGSLSAKAPPAPSLEEKADTQLVHELLRAEGLSYPDTLDEKTKAFCSVKLVGKKSTVEQLSDALEMIQKSSCDAEQQMAGLRFITSILEEELEREKQEKRVVRMECELSRREKMGRLLVELLTAPRVEEKLVLVLGLQMLCRFMAKYDWRVLFALEGGLHSVLQCMQKHSTSALVQQAGLAALKILLGAGNCELPGGYEKHYPLKPSDARVVQEIFAGLGPASSKVPGHLLCAIPAAIKKMLSTPGSSAAVRNGLLVLNRLIDYHKGLAEQMEKCDLYGILQSCCQAGQSSNEILAQIVLSRLAGRKPSLSQENAVSATSFGLKDIDVPQLLSSLHTSNVCKEMVQALECCVCAFPVGNSCESLADVLLLKDLMLLGSEKDVLLGTLRLLNKFLDSSWEDSVPWHKCIESCLSSMMAHLNDQEVVQESIEFLHHLATLDRDCAVFMCCLRTEEALAKVVEKHGSGLPRVTELGDLVSKCEKYAILYKKMTASILAGCTQVVLGQIEEHRQTHQPINIPFLDVFLHSLCHGCTTEVKDHKCWERVEVSSNPQQASKLTDGNPKTYWESNGHSTSHHINIYMHRGVVIRQMSLSVASEDSSYMPARIVVMGGKSASNISFKLNTVTVPPSASRVILLENLNCFWPIIQIKIKRCQQGGIDTRVRGIEVLGPKPTFWPIFKEQLCRRTYLFYTTKAHTWCQEISEDRMQLLQLFNRLNSALRHEQVFADRFLPDDEAAQALGKTCWEALISPLVQSITTPDPSGISPLSWLLSQYLENLEASRSTKSRAAIFNSRVRRLSHLLVHVDSSSPEPEELKPPVKSNGKNGKNKESSSGTVKAAAKKPSSTNGITQCWKGVVQQQVQLFLESSWQAPDFVERYCNTYLRLRTAMEELFGQQMSFMLALCHGFSGGLLQLSFLTAMHVSEQFARYIDRWIQESWADSGNVETLQRLQQSLEPVLFLAGLELANTFEHFYRYYLGDRLLSQGKTWLECAVVEHIGLCFPNRFPQQMLKNLSELEEQQQQFHLFQLEQLDKHLLEVDQDGAGEEEMEEGEMVEAQQLFSQEEEAEVKVLALSPRCWTISSSCYLEDPARFFPESLSQHLCKFADFYTQSQSRFGLEHTKPRRLQWTWLGHAELEYQGCLLHVSTLQMYILLCFNTAEEVSVEKLFQVTGLSRELLSAALKPLAMNGILIQSQNILRLNEATLDHEPSQLLWLLPKQTYFSVEENKGKTLERKRNTICCRLLEILKEERELHIDSLVFRVIDACQKPKPASVPKFSRFCCSSADVLSCVLHLLNQGSIQRREDNPHLLQCISTEAPALPAQRKQPQVVFQTVEIKKVPTAPCPEKRQAFSTFR